MPRSFKLPGRDIQDDSPAYVIAEIGHNHQGSLEKAVQLFKEAADAGVDAVKLQKRDNRSLYTRAAYDRPYDNSNSFGETYGEHREFLEFGREAYSELSSLAAELGVDFMSTAFDHASVDFLADFPLAAMKIASGDLTNLPLLKHAARVAKALVISTGGGTLEQIRRLVDTIAPINSNLCLLQCTAAYPAEPEDLNLRVISTLRTEFPGIVIGLSDHYNGIAMAPPAYVLGARVFEKHFTLNHTWKGTDHPFSLEPIGMSKLVRDLRRVHVALGDGVKAPKPCEAAPLKKMAKSLVAARPLAKGTRLTEADVAAKSPGGGLTPDHLDSLLGGVLAHDVAEDEPLLPTMLTASPASGTK